MARRQEKPMKDKKPSVAQLVWAGLASGRLRAAVSDGSFKNDALDGIRNSDVPIPSKLRLYAMPILSMLLLIAVPILTMLWLGALAYSAGCAAASCEPIRAYMVDVGREDSWGLSLTALGAKPEQIKKVMKDRAYAMGRSRSSFEIDEALLSWLTVETESWLLKTANQERSVVQKPESLDSASIARRALSQGDTGGVEKSIEQLRLDVQSNQASPLQALAMAELRQIAHSSRVLSMGGSQFREAFSPWSILQVLFSKSDQRSESNRVAGSKGVDICLGLGGLAFMALFAMVWRSCSAWRLAAGWARAREMELSMDWEAHQLMRAASKGKKVSSKRL